MFPELGGQHVVEQPLEQQIRPLRLSAHWRTRLLRIAGLLLVIGISGAILFERDKLSALRRYGYPGVFVISMLSSATVFLPAPGIAVIFATGSVLNPILVGLVAGLGEALGELTGYLAGASGRAIIQDRERYQQLVAKTRRYGLFVILLMSIIPNPTFDLVGVAAGALNLPISRFLLACWIGKTIKATLVALLGAGSLGLLSQFL
ncbi:MAG: VTT domain-containing protein [Anaerolineae bacterium]|nr:VTT domain-containing protein [Anaerolineae bacterium]MDW8098879.1 VTT domain-containing protein [Anaerolineae bacterium]